MNLKEELKTQEACMQHHQDAIAQTQERINEITDKIAEAEKPNLRHGDYGADTYNKMPTVLMRTTINSELIKWAGAEKPANYNNDTMTPGDFQKLGNIFDDLKALQEDRAEFEIGEGVWKVRGEVVACGDFLLTESGDGGSKVLIASNFFDKFILYLQQMRATQLRERNG